MILKHTCKGCGRHYVVDAPPRHCRRCGTPFPEDLEAANRLAELKGRLAGRLLSWSRCYASAAESN